MKKNWWFCVLLLVVFYAVGCTQSGPRYSFISVDKTGLSVEEASKIDAVVLDMGNKGFSTKEVAFTRVISGNEEKIFVTDKDGITKGRVIAGSVSGALNGAASATIGGFLVRDGLRNSGDRVYTQNSSSSGATATATTGP